jgi:hypothetical protein
MGMSVSERDKVRDKYKGKLADGIKGFLRHQAP